MAEHIIVPARSPKDSADFARLFIMSDPDFNHVLFGGTEDEVARNLFRYRRNILSFEHAHFVQVNGKSAGMLLGYDWRANKKERPKTALLTLRYMKVKLITQMRHLQWTGAVLGKIDDGTFYISSMAVYPEFRCQGLGTSLLSHAEESARKLGARSIDLDAETCNQNAIRLYQSFGLDIVGEPRGTVIDGQEFEFIRMVKDICTST